MPLFNAIGQPRWNSPLIRFFGMKIGSAAAPSLAPEIAPSFDVNQQDDPQLAFLRGEKIAGYGRSLAAAAGFYSSAALRNPANSGILVIVDTIMAYSATSAATVSISQLNDLTSSGPCTPRDTRWGNNVTTTARYTYRNDSAGPVAGARIAEIPAGTFGMHEMPVVLSPGFALVLETSSVNAALAWAFRFSERSIPAEELQTG